jgi:plastocyanin
MTVRTRVAAMLLTISALGLVAACSSSPSPTATVPKAAGTAPAAQSGGVKAQIAAFTQPSISVKVGGTVTWNNADDLPHSATAKDGSWDAGVISPGGTGQPATFSKAGVFNYMCKIHPSMSAKVTVTA